MLGPRLVREVARDTEDERARHFLNRAADELAKTCDELFTELRDELQADLSQKIRAEIERDLRPKIREKLRKKLSDTVEGQLSHDLTQERERARELLDRTKELLYDLSREGVPTPKHRLHKQADEIEEFLNA